MNDAFPLMPVPLESETTAMSRDEIPKPPTLVCFLLFLARVETLELHMMFPDVSQMEDVTFESERDVSCEFPT